MRQVLVGALTSAVSLWLAVSPALAQREFVFFAQFNDASGKPVTTLSASDIEVSEDGAAGKVVKLEPVDWPVRVALLLDNGTGSGDRIVQVRNGAKGFGPRTPGQPPAAAGPSRKERRNATGTRGRTDERGLLVARRVTGAGSA